MTDDERLAEIAARAAAATPGPWARHDVVGWVHLKDVGEWGVESIPRRSSGHGGDVWPDFLAVMPHGRRAVPDADFIAAARDDIPYLLEQLRQALAEIEMLRRPPFTVVAAQPPPVTTSATGTNP
jgi:hypothetical protein